MDCAVPIKYQYEGSKGDAEPQVRMISMKRMDAKDMTRNSEQHLSCQCSTYSHGTVDLKVKSPLADPVFLFAIPETLDGVTRKSVSEVGPWSVPNKVSKDRVRHQVSSFDIS